MAVLGSVLDAEEPGVCAADEVELSTLLPTSSTGNSTPPAATAQQYTTHQSPVSAIPSPSTSTVTGDRPDG